MPPMQWSTREKVWTKQCVKCSAEFKAPGENWNDAWINMQRYFNRGVGIKRNTDELQSRCRTCQNNYRHGRDSGPSLEDLIQNQNGVCKVCEIPISPSGRGAGTGVTDHCHKTSIIRGALCNKCNIGMHYVDADVWLAKAIAYRDSFRG